MATPAKQPGKLVLFFMENHTSDNICSDVAGFDGDTSLPSAADVHPDQPHDRHTWLTRATAAVRQRYTRAQLPLLHSLMDAYTVCDRYFSDVGANSFPNHAFAIGADAGGSTSNPHTGTPPFLTKPGVTVSLDAAGRTWANYGNGFAFRYYTNAAMHANVRPVTQLATDAESGTLPDVSYVFAPSGKDFHPGRGTSMKASEQWLHQEILGVAGGRRPDGGPLWDDVMMLVTFDDWGGWVDHVTPPVVESDADGPYRMGSRVPMIVIGPYAKPRHVSHAQASHTSIVAYQERLYGLPATNPRTVAAAETALADTFDLTQPPLPAPVAAPARPRPGRSRTHAGT
ncbi:MAG TPA: alkaline phosphatase family protein [Candidatus Dormibacteraeota bacterium]|nr:alkaline phosphatase family protein [Candidatus Dormibacteraeota bacterium]